MRMTKEQVTTIAKRLAKTIAPKFGLAPSELAQIAVAIAWKESRFDPLAENNTSTARGLMQVLAPTQRETEKKYAKVPFAPAKYKTKHFPEAPIGKDKMFDPEYNMMIGMNYLAYQLKRYGDIGIGIHAYNQGSYPGKWKTDGKMYSDSVLSYMSENLPMSEFKEKNLIAKVIDKIKPRKQNTTAKSGNSRFVLKKNGVFY